MEEVLELLPAARAQFASAAIECVSMCETLLKLNPKKMTTAEVQRVFEQVRTILTLQEAANAQIVTSIDSIYSALRQTDESC